MKYEDLKILDDLKEKGSITEEEYQREKTKILNQPDVPASGMTPLWGMGESTFLMLMHLSQFLTGFILPLIMWLTNKDFNENVNKHGKNIMNFTISYYIYGFVSSILIVLIIGIPLLVALGVMVFVFIIIASVKAANGEYWKYPLTIEFLK